MYIVALLTVLSVGAWLAFSGISQREPPRLWAGTALTVGAIGFYALMSFWGEMLWYENLGFSDRFWTIVATRSMLAVAGGAAGYLIGAMVLSSADRPLRLLVSRLAAIAGVLWSVLSWQESLLFLNGRATATVDPMLGFSTGFYLFALPLLDRLFWLALFIAIASLVAVLLFREAPDGRRIRFAALADEPKHPLAIPIASAFLAAVLGYGEILRIFHLLYSDLGVVKGPGWTDIHIRLPALMLMGVVFLGAGVLPLFRSFRALMTGLMERRVPIGRPHLTAVVSAWLVIAVAWSLTVVVVPAMVQWLIVRPNEVTFEIPYIARNIEFTRRGFGLDDIEERQFEPRETFTHDLIADNEHLLSEVRLWDWRALDAVYKQFQEIRLYYEFVDVDIDRYTIGDRYRQVMVSARELSKANLPEQSQTFVNKRFKYTHGYGYTLAPVSDFTPQGLPNLLVQDIPPRAKARELELSRPEIYYGELTLDAAVVNTREAEFDYPSGEANVYAHYAGSGGVQMSNFWRKLLFGWKFDGTLLLLSSYPTDESRVMFHRRVQDRVSRVAPFLVFDEDPYIVAADGRLHWIIDAYTSSSYYPYSQPFDSGEWIEFQNGSVSGIGQRTVSRLGGQNYVRNSVKAVVDAYDGSVDLYVFDPDDPIAAAWRRTFPDLFKDASDMPSELRQHVRYPQDFLLAQGLIFAKYHMSDPEVFYNQEDLWVRATEKHYGDIKPVEPYYVMWERPGSDRAEFVLILPFTPKNRQVLIGWIAGLSDGDNYGRFLAYKFGKDRRVLGPQQVETKIDQDPFLSGQLTLWDQQGSEVIRGNVLAIPIDDALLYVEPIYLRAETAAYPELRLIAVMHGDDLSYAETLDEALLGLFSPGDERKDASASELAREARAAFNAYLSALGDREFEDAASHLQRLSALLEQLNR